MMVIFESVLNFKTSTIELVDEFDFSNLQYSLFPTLKLIPPIFINSKEGFLVIHSFTLCVFANLELGFFLIRKLLLIQFLGLL